MRISIVFVIIWILGFETPGQTPRFDRFDISTGLSQNNINGLVIDDVGNVWVGTLDGLNRYNGYEFDVFKPLAGEGGHISGNHVIDMGEGLDGDVWITTRDGMLNRFEPGRGQFIQYGDSVFQESEIYSVRNLIQINDSLLFYSHDAFVGVLNIYQNVCKTKKAPGFVHGITAKGDSAIIHGSFGLVYVKPFSSGKETTIQFSPIAEAPCYHLHRSDNDWYAVTEQGISCFDASFTEKKTVVMFDQVELFNLHLSIVLPCRAKLFGWAMTISWFGLRR
jgi:hypothetical protein